MISLFNLSVFPSPAHFFLSLFFQFPSSLQNSPFLFFADLSHFSILTPHNPSMGKYINKSNLTGDVPFMDVFSNPTTTTTTTVRTRAASKSLALPKLHKSSLPDPTSDLSFSYLQLRTRRLDKTETSLGASTKHVSKPKKSARNSKAPSSLDGETRSFGFVSQIEDLEFQLSKRYVFMCFVASLLILNLKLVYGGLRVSLINVCFKFEILANT